VRIIVGLSLFVPRHAWRWLCLRLCEPSAGLGRKTHQNYFYLLNRQFTQQLTDCLQLLRRWQQLATLKPHNFQAIAGQYTG